MVNTSSIIKQWLSLNTHRKYTSHVYKHAKSYYRHGHTFLSPDKARLSCPRQRNDKVLFGLQMKSNEGHWQLYTVLHISIPQG